MLLNWIVVSKDCETLFPVLTTFCCFARWTATGSHLFVILEVFYSCCHLLWLFAVANSDATACNSHGLIVGFTLFFCCHHRGFLHHCCHRCAHAESWLIVYFSFSCCRHYSVCVADGGATVHSWHILHLSQMPVDCQFSLFFAVTTMVAAHMQKAGWLFIFPFPVVTTVLFMWPIVTPLWLLDGFLFSFPVVATLLFDLAQLAHTASAPKASWMLCSLEDFFLFLASCCSTWPTPMSLCHKTWLIVNIFPCFHFSIPCVATLLLSAIFL